MILSCRAERAKNDDDHNGVDDDGEETCTGLSCRDGNQLIPDSELIPQGFYECKGCAVDQQELADVIAHCGSLESYDRAMAAFQLSQRFEKYGIKLKAVPALSLDEMQIVEAERARYETREMNEARKQK